MVSESGYWVNSRVAPIRYNPAALHGQLMLRYKPYKALPDDVNIRLVR